MDRLTLMDYVDKVNGIITGAEHEIAYADSIGKEVVIGLETRPSRVSSEWPSTIGEPILP